MPLATSPSDTIRSRQALGIAARHSALALALAHRRCVRLALGACAVTAGCATVAPSTAPDQPATSPAFATPYTGQTGQASVPARLPLPSPTSSASLAQVAQADNLYAQGRHAEAALAFQDLTRRVPRNAYFWFRLGGCQLQLQQPGDAVQSLQQAIALDPSDGRFAYNLALAHATLARTAFVQARALLPSGSPWRQEAEQQRLLLEAVTGPARASGARNQ